jgi:hypothetical protein
VTGRFVALLVAALLLVGCGGQAPSRPPAPAPAASGSPRAETGCRGVSYDEVRGQRPAYGARRLREYPALPLACRAFWLPHTAHWFTPQAIALDGDTAWVSGYRWNRDVADRPCRLLRVDLRTGRVLVDQARLIGSVGDSAPTFCRHGGGLARDAHGLWVAERERLWLVDPARVGVDPGRAVLRMWRIHAPQSGSTVEVHDGRLALGGFRRRSPARVGWFDLRALLRPGVTDIVGRARAASEVAPASSDRITGFVQGMTWRDGLVLTASHRGCGQVVLPGGRRIGVMPGIEDLEFTDRNRVWVVSESAARVYQDRHGPVVPMLSEYDAAKVLALRQGGRCGPPG